VVTHFCSGECVCKYLRVFKKDVILFIYLFIYLLFMYLSSFIFYVYSVLPACMYASQERPPDLIIHDRDLPYGCWELNSGLLEEQPVLFTSEPSLQPNI
jgi:hypothetical protein